MHKVTLSAAEFAARMAVALQDVNKMQYIAYENEQGELWFPAPSPTYQVGTMDSAGRLRLGGGAGQTPVTEDSAALIATRVNTLSYVLRAQNPLSATAEGVFEGDSGTGAWTPITPVTVTADGAGLPPATALIALSGGEVIDIMIWMTVDTVAGANQYQFDFRTDPLAAVGGIAVVVPDWTAIELPLPANGTTPVNTWGHRMMTSVVSSAFGIAEGVNADWPNAAQVTFYGFYRYL